MHTGARARARAHIDFIPHCPSWYSSALCPRLSCSPTPAHFTGRPSPNQTKRSPESWENRPPIWSRRDNPIGSFGGYSIHKLRCPGTNINCSYHFWLFPLTLMEQNLSSGSRQDLSTSKSPPPTSYLDFLQHWQVPCQLTHRRKLVNNQLFLNARQYLF